MKRVLSLLAALALLAGCAAQVTNMNVPGIEQSAGLKVADMRPDTEKQQEIFSYVVSNEAYGLYRFPDTIVAPAGMRILQHRAFEKFGAGAPEVKVHHLVIYRNQQSEFRQAAILGGLGGAIGGAIAYSIAKDSQGYANSQPNRGVFESLTGPNEFKRALYTAEENPERTSVNVIYVDTEVGGKRMFTRSVSPVLVNRENNLPSGLEAALKYHFSQY